MLAVLVGAALAQTPPPLVWQPVVEVRERLTVAGPPGELVTEAGQRARVGVEVARENLGARVSFEEVRRWDTAEAGVPLQFAPALAEGWARLTWDFSSAVGGAITVGRQALRLHEGRLLGTDDVELDARLLDAVRVEARAEPLHLEIVSARRAAGPDEPLGIGIVMARAGAEVGNPIDNVLADVVWVHDARRTERATSTAGLYARAATGRWRGRGELYLQAGAEGVGSLAAFSGGFVVGANERLAFHLRYDGASGDASLTRGQVAAWQPVVGDTRTFWGAAGVFDDLPEATGHRGLSDLHAVVELRPSARLHAVLAGHRFWSPVDGQAFGAEADASVRWFPSPFGHLEAGVAAFRGGVGRADRGYGWLELHVSF